MRPRKLVATTPVIYIRLSVKIISHSHTCFVNGKLICSESDKGFKALYGVGMVGQQLVPATTTARHPTRRLITFIFTIVRNRNEIDALLRRENAIPDPVNGPIMADKNTSCAGRATTLKVESDKQRRPRLRCIIRMQNESSRDLARLKRSSVFPGAVGSFDIIRQNNTRILTTSKYYYCI